MKVPFELEWMGGAAEHHFRKARPGIDELPWGTVDPSKYAPAAVDQARASWTEVAINEYRAVASFSEVLRALVDVKAPLDLLGMTSDFLADECSHVELASRMAMELGGAAPREVDFDRFTARPRGLTPMQRANELVLRVGCIAEAFSGGTATVSYASTSHPLPARRLRDDPARRSAPPASRRALLRVGAVAHRRRRAPAVSAGCCSAALRGLAPFWKSQAARTEAPPPWPEEDLKALGWLGPAQFAPIAKEVVVRDILDPLETIGIAIAPDERADPARVAADRADVASRASQPQDDRERSVGAWR